MNRVFGLVFLVVCACGGSDAGFEFEGVYQRQSHLEGDCPTATTEVSSDLYFALVGHDLLGSKLMSLNECTSSTECDFDTVNLFSVFEREEGQWKENTFASSGDENGCVLTAKIGVINETPSGIEIKWESRSGMYNAANQDDCLDNGVAQAEANFDTMTCFAVEVLTATAVP